MAMLDAARGREEHVGKRSPLAAGHHGSHLFQQVMERVAEACIPEFERLAGEGAAITLSLAATTQETAAEAIVAGGAMTTALFEIPAADSRLAVSLEDDFLQLFIEVMCGGTGAEPPSVTSRPGTSIDRQFARIVFGTLNTVLAKECTTFGLGGMVFGQIQAKPDPSALGKRDAKVTVATFSVECFGREGSVRVAFPQAVTDRIRQDVLPSAKSAAAKVDPEWSGRLQSEISRTAVRLDAFLDADKLTLGQVARLKVGQILTLPRTAPSRCELRCDDKPLFRCELGQGEGRYSLRIEEGLPHKPARDLAKADAFDTLSD